ncbi:uncharacterized protein LOC122502954 [Leptopilina heterotoma]|uniref:uncharacterized protein LOC122502954 n=1 Tax=Leptopilina heterotoma TaxID=63436 RepID=UPI001CAA084A|nr:uncharacterized protein LOC122502954 [Leptopilina heterotoma]
MGDMWRSKLPSGSGQASGGAIRRVVRSHEVSSSSGSDVTLPPVGVRSVGRGISFAWQDEEQACAARPGTGVDRGACSAESREFLESQYAVEELDSIVMDQEDDPVLVNEGTKKHKACGREEPEVQVRPREPNVMVVPRPADRFREEARLARPMLTVGRIFCRLDRIPTDPDLDPPMGACFNCWSMSHKLAYCPEPIDIFCRNCGRFGVMMEDCPRCARAYRLWMKRSGSSVSLERSDQSESSRRGQGTKGGNKGAVYHKKVASVVVRAEVDEPGQLAPVQMAERLPLVGSAVEPSAVEVVPDPVPSATGLMDDLRLLEASLVGLPQELAIAARTAFWQDRQRRGFP